MKYLYSFHGGQPHIRKYQIGFAWAATRPGIPVTVPTLTNNSGIEPATTTTCQNAIGVSMDVPKDRATSQQSDGSNPESLVSVAINPGAVYQAILSGDNGRRSALTVFTETAGSSSGALITAAIGTAYDDGYVWGYSGQNAGALRKIEAVDGSTASAEIAFQFDIAVGDQFLAVPFGPAEDAGMALTDDLDEIDASMDNQSEPNFRCVELAYRDATGNGRYDSSAHIILCDHLFSGNLTYDSISAIVTPS